MPTRRVIPIAVTLITYMILSAEPVFAWGPVTHANIAAQVLGQLSLIPSAAAGVLSRYALDYIYGSLAADVVFAKRMSRIKQFCHHWSTGFDLLSMAGSDRQRAFALGYLSHLAADTVAHNKFVPKQVTSTRCTYHFGHLYWELRADSHGEAKDAVAVREALLDSSGHHYELLATRLTQTRTLLSFGLNMDLFRLMTLMSSGHGWKKGMGLWSRCSRWELPVDTLLAYRDESVDRILDLLANLEKSPVLAEDPNGTAALEQTKVARKYLRRLRRFGILWEGVAEEAARHHAPQIGARLMAAACNSPQLVELQGTGLGNDPRLLIVDPASLPPPAKIEIWPGLTVPESDMGQAPRPRILEVGDES